MKLLLTLATLLACSPAFAIYHGSESCVYQKGARKIELANRLNSEGLGFEGLRLTKGKKTVTIDSGEFTMPEAELRDNRVVKIEKDKIKASFEVLAYKKVRDDSTEDECSLSNDLEAKVTIRVTGLSGNKPEDLVFTCKREGFNPNMGCRQREYDEENAEESK